MKAFASDMAKLCGHQKDRFNDGRIDVEAEHARLVGQSASAVVLFEFGRNGRKCQRPSLSQECLMQDLEEDEAFATDRIADAVTGETVGYFFAWRDGTRQPLWLNGERSDVIVVALKQTDECPVRRILSGLLDASTHEEGGA